MARIDRRSVLASGVAFLAAPHVVRAQAPVTIRMGALKLIHSIAPHFYERFTPAGYKVEVIPFESPTECKNGVVTQSVDFGVFGIAAAILGAAAKEPLNVIASCCNKGMAVIAKIDSAIASIKDMKGKKVAIWPGSTQEVFILERLRMEGMTIKDIEAVRISFSEMHLALARGDVEAYVGAEPAPGVSISSGVGKLVEYPYSTPIGPLNMILSASDKGIKDDPERIRLIVDIHRKAADYLMAHPGEMVDLAVQKLGQQRKSIEIAQPNVELAWKLDDVFVQRAKAYARLMLENKQIRQQPDVDRYVAKQFM